MLPLWKGGSKEVRKVRKRFDECCDRERANQNLEDDQEVQISTEAWLRMMQEELAEEGVEDLDNLLSVLEDQCEAARKGDNGPPRATPLGESGTRNRDARGGDENEDPKTPKSPSVESRRSTPRASTPTPRTAPSRPGGSHVPTASPST